MDSRATSTIGREVSITIFTVSSLNSGVYFMRCSGIHPPRSGLDLIRSRVRNRGGAPGHDLVVDAADPDGGVGEVDDGVPGGIEGGECGLARRAADSPISWWIPAVASWPVPAAEPVTTETAATGTPNRVTGKAA